MMSKRNKTILLFSLLILSSLLSACDGGLFGTGDGDVIEQDSADVSAEDTLEQTPDTGIQAGEENTDQLDTDDANEGQAELDTMGEEEDMMQVGSEVFPIVPVSLSFSNNLPSGLDPLDNNAPFLKIINLSGFDLSASTELTLSDAQSVLAIATQSTSSLIPVNIGESTITVTSADTNETLVSVDPLNSVEDSLTTLIIAPNDQASSATDPTFMATAIDTRVVSTESSVAIMRVVYNITSEVNSIPDITLVPIEDNPNGSELVLHSPLIAQEELTTYTTVSAGTYSIRTSDDSFPQERLDVAPGSVYTLVVTGQLSSTLYIELDSEL